MPYICAYTFPARDTFVTVVLLQQAEEPVLASFLHQNIISHSSLGKAMAVLLANKLSSRTLLGTQLMQLISEAYRDDPVSLSARHDLCIEDNLHLRACPCNFAHCGAAIYSDGCLLQTILEACKADLHAVVDRDPACEKFSQCMLYFKGFQAIQCHRLNHWLWRNNRRVRTSSSLSACIFWGLLCAMCKHSLYAC